MKKVFTIYKVVSKDVHVPSTDFYARNNEPQTDSVLILQYWDHYDTEAEAEEYLLKQVSEPGEDSFIILPTYIKK